MKLQLAPQLVLVLIAAFSISAPAQTAPLLTISSPLAYQIFQRSTRLHGVIIVCGSALAAARVEARVEGTSLEGPLPGRWQRLALDQTKKQFSGQLPVVAGGFYRVEIKATNTVGQPTFLTVQHIGRRRGLRHRRSVQLHELRRSAADHPHRNGHHLQRNGMVPRQ